MRRLADLEEYLGLQGGAHAIVLYNGQHSEQVTHIKRESVRGETIEPMPNPEDDADTDARLMGGMELIEEINVVEEGGKCQNIKDQEAIQPIINTEAKANANADRVAEEMEGVESQEEVNSGMVNKNIEKGQKS